MGSFLGGNQDFISLYLFLTDDVPGSVKVKIKFTLLDTYLEPLPCRIATNNKFTTATLSASGLTSHGYKRFVKRKTLGDLLKFGKYDCFAVRVDLRFIANNKEPSSPVPPPPPPSDMLRHHLGDLLSREEHADVEFRVGRETFAAHRLVLGARSPVFKAQLLLGPNTIGSSVVVQIDDMVPRVFKAMLTFIYTDTLPRTGSKEEPAMSQCLLVAADHYGMPRLKLMCESRLCDLINLNSVGDILDLAEKHQCPALKEACFDFIGSTATLLPARETLLAVRESQELRFDRLVSLCPAVVQDQICNALENDWSCSRAEAIDISLDIENVLVDENAREPRTSGSPLVSAMKTDRPPCSTTTTTTTIFSLRDHHHLKINGYSGSLNSRRPFFKSSSFNVGGRNWRIHYRPKGSNGDSNFISFYLGLDNIVDETVMAYFTLSLLDQYKNLVPDYCRTTTMMNNFSKVRFFGFNEFIKREILERSEYLKDDSFTIRIQIHVVKETPSILVPPPDIQQHFASLFLSMECADVEFRVGGETFVAHRLVLAARSPVFNAELYSPMKEGVVTNTIQIDDMEALVFKVLLNFIYTDSLPEMEQEDESAMTQHLLVAADKYCMQRLKLICEARLHNHINAGSVAIILALADKHNCSGLKEACFNFLNSSTSPLRVMKDQECDYLAQSCPIVMKELNAIFLARDMVKVKISEGIKGSFPSSHK
jgi:speckle-type POZ protein